MTDTTDNHQADGDVTRRDFLYIATGAVGAVGAAAFLWPFIDQMNPDASALALASVEVDISAIEEGQSIKVKWRGKPVFIRFRTEKEMEEARAVALDELPDQDARNANLGSGVEATDENRTIDETLSILWKVVSQLPKNELTKVKDKFVEQYYQEK